MLKFINPSTSMIAKKGAVITRIFILIAYREVYILDMDRIKTG